MIIGSGEATDVIHVDTYLVWVYACLTRQNVMLEDHSTVIINQNQLDLLSSNHSCADFEFVTNPNQHLT